MKIIILLITFLAFISSFVQEGQCAWHTILSYGCIPTRGECVYGYYVSKDTLAGTYLETRTNTNTKMEYYLNYIAACSESFTRCPYLGGDKPVPGLQAYNKLFTYYHFVYVWVSDECTDKFNKLSADCGGDQQIHEWNAETCEGTCANLKANQGPEQCSN